MEGRNSDMKTCMPIDAEAHTQTGQGASVCRCWCMRETELGPARWLCKLDRLTRPLGPLAGSLSRLANRPARGAACCGWFD